MMINRFITLLAHWKHIIVWVAAVTFIVLLGLLIAEYRYFKNQAETMIALQTEYKNHIMATKRLLQGSTLVQNSADTASADEKKNESGENNFLILNRSLDHGKKVSASFCKRSGMSDLYAKMPQFEWVEYTDWVLSKHEQENKKAARKKRVFRRPKLIDHNQMISSDYHNARAVFQGKKIFSWPIDPKHFWLSSLFGPRKKPNGTWGFHYGLDMAAIRGTPVHAAASGIVVEAYADKGFGKTILLSHNSQFQTRYAHLDKILIKPGQTIERGQLIGRVGRTGNVRGRYDGSHLHFEVNSFGKRLNPIHLLRS